VDAGFIARFNADLYTPCHARCRMSQSHFLHCFASSPLIILQLDCNSATGRIAVSAHLMRICGCKAHCSLQCKPLHSLPCPVQHETITKVVVFSKYSSSHLQPDTLTCMESHDFVSFPHLDCNSTTDLAIVSTHNI